MAPILLPYLSLSLIGVQRGSCSQLVWAGFYSHILNDILIINFGRRKLTGANSGYVLLSPFFAPLHIIMDPTGL